MFQMSHIAANETILDLRQIFSHFRFSQILVSNNDTAFISARFSNFCAIYGIQHFHRPSNGQIERFGDTFERALTKTKNIPL